MRAFRPVSGCPEGPAARRERSLPREGKGGGMGILGALAGLLGGSIERTQPGQLLSNLGL